MTDCLLIVFKNTLKSQRRRQRSAVLGSQTRFESGTFIGLAFVL